MKKIFALIFSSALFVGCQGEIEIRQERWTPDDIPGVEACIEGDILRVEQCKLQLEEAKLSRDKMVEAAKNADGWFAQETIVTKLSSENYRVRVALLRLQAAEEALMQSKAKLERLKHEDSRTSQ